MVAEKLDRDEVRQRGGERALEGEDDGDLHARHALLRREVSDAARGGRDARPAADQGTQPGPRGAGLGLLFIEDFTQVLPQRDIFRPMRAHALQCATSSCGLEHEGLRVRGRSSLLKLVDVLKVHRGHGCGVTVVEQIEAADDLVVLIDALRSDDERADRA